MNDPLEHAREQLREEFEQLRGEIEGLGAEEGGGGDPPSGGGFRDRARGSLAVLALTAAVAAAAGTFALNGGRTQKEGSVSVPPPSNGPEPIVAKADRGGAEPPSLLALIGPGLQTDILGSSAGLPGAGHPSTGPSPVFVVNDPISAVGHGSRGGDVKNADPVGHSPTPTPTAPAPAPEPDEPSLAFSPPPVPAGETGGGPGHDEAPGDGGKPDGGHTAATTLDEEDDSGGGDEGPGGGDEGPGKGKGHIKANGKGHGESPGKGHAKDQGGAAPAAAPPPVAPPPPPPGPGPKGNPGKGGGPDPGHGKSTAPGQVGK
jgi:hypothetical protein